LTFLCDDHKHCLLFLGAVLCLTGISEITLMQFVGLGYFHASLIVSVWLLILSHTDDAEYQGDWLFYLSFRRSWRRFGVTLFPVTDVCGVFSQSEITPIVPLV
jgi:hypothetical protein